MNAFRAIEPRTRGAEIDAEDGSDLGFRVRRKHGVRYGADDLVSVGIPGFRLLSG
jgi:hypothetical protein